MKLFSLCVTLKYFYIVTTISSRLWAQKCHISDTNGSIWGLNRDHSHMYELIRVTKPDIWWTTMMEECRKMGTLVTLVGLSMCKWCAVSNSIETGHCWSGGHSREISIPTLTYLRFARLNYQPFVSVTWFIALFRWQWHNWSQDSSAGGQICAVWARWALPWTSGHSLNAFVTEMGFPMHWKDTPEALTAVMTQLPLPNLWETAG